MSKIFCKPYLLFWISIPIILLVIFFSGDSTLDINIHDTYFVIEHAYISYLVSITLGLIGLGYWIMIKLNRKLSKTLIAIHELLTLGGFLAIWISNMIFKRVPLFDSIGTENLVLTIFALLIIIGQVFYLLNLIMGLFKKEKRSNCL
ncbi:hypothetical protein [Aquimarina sediminis]|uniref:hypothetical protein n=1 Tax=Aquimarina sediminis TaxID=2070536 RepID=UPI000CA06387|nr:hypothetical protein [Aquimarina sediminis]